MNKPHDATVNTLLKYPRIILQQEIMRMVRRPSVHEIMTSKKVPKAIGAYPHAVKVVSPGEMLFVSGMLPLEVSGRLTAGDIKKQAEVALNHVKNIVLDSKFTMDDVTHCTIYVLDIAHIEAIDPIYQRMFVGMNLPARSVVQVAALPMKCGIQVDAIAVKRGTNVDELLADDRPPQS